MGLRGGCSRNRVRVCVCVCVCEKPNKKMMEERKKATTEALSLLGNVGTVRKSVGDIANLPTLKCKLHCVAKLLFFGLCKAFTTSLVFSLSLSLSLSLDLVEFTFLYVCFAVLYCLFN